jgi:hypothetical protein
MGAKAVEGTPISSIAARALGCVVAAGYVDVANTLRAVDPVEQGEIRIVRAAAR